MTGDREKIFANLLYLMKNLYPENIKNNIIIRQIIQIFKKEIFVKKIQQRRSMTVH